MVDGEKKGVATTIKKYFDLKPDQKMQDFLAEYKELTDEDKRQLVDGIENGALTY